MKKIISKVLIVALLASMLMTVMATTAFAATTIYITGESVYVRKGPSKDYAARGTVHYGEAYSATSTDKDSRGVKWYKISYKNGTGWVSSRYTSTTASSGSSATGTIKATSGSTYIRADYNKEAEIITTLSKGNSVSYLGETRTDSRGVAWYKVQTKSGKTGWVSSKYTTKY